MKKEFEVICTNGELLRFGGGHFWQFKSHINSEGETIEDKDVLQVWCDYADSLFLITEIIKPIRIEYVNVNERLIIPPMILESGKFCVHCNRRN